MSEEIEAHVLERYEILQKLGKGAYGIVWKAKDKSTGALVALKKVFDAFQNSTDAQRTYREVMYLQQLKGHDNIIGLQSLLRAYNNKDLYLVFDLMETDLHLVIRAKILKPVHKQFIIYQLFKALKYMHSAHLVHRDLKPANMLLNSDCLMKLADFGLARSLAHNYDSEAPIVSDYIATRWYRAPEILLGSTSYSLAVDIWSAGCILAEVLLEKVLFPGKSSLNQIELIIELLGRPTTVDLENMKISYANELLPNLKSKKVKSFGTIFEECPPEAIDLLRKLLIYDPTKRLTVTEVLAHPYLRKFHNEAEETICTKTVVIPIDDAQKLSLKAYRDAIYKDINHHLKRHQIRIYRKPSCKPPNPPFIDTTVQSFKQTSKSTKHDVLEPKFLQNRKSSLKENMRNEKPNSTAKTVLKNKNKNKSEDNNIMGTILLQTTKYNKNVEISRSNIITESKGLFSTNGSYKQLLPKGFFRRRNESKYSIGLLKKAKCYVDKKICGDQV